MLQMLSFLVASVLISGPTCEDVSPNQPNAPRKTRASSAGLTLAIAGDHSKLYAVSLNAGVWRSDKGGPWHQLSHSPACANCITVDPWDSKHVAVGERNGLAVDIRKNHCGVWESKDAGDHWSYIFDPLSISGCDSQAIPAITFDKQYNLFIATTAGVGVRRKGESKFDFSASPSGIGRVTALSDGTIDMWARTGTALLRTNDSGRSWSVIDIPKKVGADSVRFSSRGDLYSLGASQSVVMMPCYLDPGPGGNRNSLILYDVAGKTWHAQSLSSGNGTGLGGRRFAKYESRNLIYGGGQEIHQAFLLSNEFKGSISFDKPVQTTWGGPYGTPPQEIHSDTWDMHLDPAGVRGAWIACDGGVFATNESVLSLFNDNWLPFNDGLHTHHIHTITALEMPGNDARLAYPTSDNDAFYFDPAKGWMNEEWLGDVNWTAGDVGNPSMALMVRRSAGFAMLTAFHQGIPKGASFAEDQAISLCNDEHYDGPTSFAFIQTLVGENPEYPLLDAVRLVDLPLKTGGKPVSGELGQPRPNPVLMRNRAFAASPDANASQYSGWKVEREAPLGTTAFRVSGGHANPTYYAYAAGKIYGSLPGAGWEELSNVSDGRPFTILPGNQFGPLFVNPFDPRQVYVLAKDGIKVSLDGGNTFHDDRQLTALLTGDGKYSVAVGELTGNSRDVVLASRANSSATLADMAFDRHHLGIAVACSPFTGVFIREGDGRWRSFERILPTPRTAIVSVAIAGESIYCATEGRGVLRIRNYRQ